MNIKDWKIIAIIIILVIIHIALLIGISYFVATLWSFSFWKVLVVMIGIDFLANMKIKVNYRL